ncbi:MAG: stage II sporulation protein M [Gammaproteobacteria bacterium]|jgi:uncharacterized membrane protein SpoIIM required for sporulation
MKHSSAKKSDSAVAHWLQGRMPGWKRQESLLQSQRGRRHIDSDEVLEFVNGYRSLSRDLSLARHALPDSQITVYLQSLLLRSYDLIHRKPYNLLRQFFYMLRYELPQAVRELRGAIIASFSILAISALIGWWLVYTYPEMVSLFASPKMIDTVQKGGLWTDNILSVLPSSILSQQIMFNNIVVAMSAFVLGTLYGLGTLYFMSLNGAMLGSMFAFTARYHLAGRLFEFIIAHGIVELSVIILAGAAGMKIGEAIVRPGQLSRRDAFNRAASTAGKVIAVGALLLVGSGLIEGYISPNHHIGLATRISVGVGYAVFMLLLLSGRLWPRTPQAGESGPHD